MAKSAQPLTVAYFASGLYTHRSQLFSPYRSVGVNVVTYHDAAIDGLNMEIGALLKWVRRAGFSRFNQTQFASNEWPLQFYYAREPDGTVVDFVDTTVNFSIFNSTATTPLFAKTTTNQGFIQQIGGITYYANGTDLNKWSGPTTGVVSGWGIAAPPTAPTTALVANKPGYWASNATLAPVSIAFVIDYNGNLQYTTSGSETTGPFEPVWSTVITPPLGSLVGVNAVGGVTFDGISPNAIAWRNAGPYSAAIWAPTAAAGSSAILIDSNGNLQQTTVGGTTGGTPPTWNTTVGANTTDGSVTWINRGPATISVQAGYTYAYGFRTIWGHLSTLSPLLTVGTVMGALSIALAGGSPQGVPECFQTLSISSVTIDSKNNLTLVYAAAAGLMVLAGQDYTLTGMSNATFLNGQIITVASTGTNSFTASFTHAAYPTTADTGQANFNCIELYRTADGGGILYFDQSLNPGHPIFDPTTGLPWTITDTTADANLDTELIGPLAHSNDPPPGTPGSLITTGGTILAYWQGRIWMAAANKVYFNAGPDCINGVPEEAWPPANVFQYPGNVTGLTVTSQGLVVWLSDATKMILGGPQTLSFYPYDLLNNFGVSSPNAITQDGDNISVFTTQKQCFTLNDTGKTETGNYIVNELESFPPDSTYMAFHRQGSDAALWIADGSANAYRYSLNINAWASKAVPVGGIGALKSVETSVGQYTLCAGRPTGGGYILGRQLGQWEDDGATYPCYITIGNIVLGNPGGQLTPVYHISGYFDAEGTLGPLLNAQGGLLQPTGGPTYPSIDILPNEISGATGIGFINLGQIPISEYTTANIPASTLLSLRYPVDSMNSQKQVSQLMHHLQIRVTFPPENAGNSVRSLSVVFEKNP